MKLNPVNFLIAVAISGVLAYGFWSVGGDLRAYVGIGAFVFCAATLAPAIGFTFGSARRGVIVRMISFGFLLVALVLNGVFSLLPLSATARSRLLSPLK